MTQSDLAGRLGIVPSHLSQIMSGDRKPSITLAAELERLTAIPARDFAGVA